MGVGTPDTAVDDICQEVVAALFKWREAPPDITKDDDEGDCRWGLMYGIAANKTSDHFRRAGRNKSDPVDEMPDTKPGEGADEAFFAGWDRQHIWEVALKIANTPEQKARLELMMTDLSAREKAKILGKGETNVRVTEHRLRAKIGKELRRQFGGQEIGFGYFVPPLSPDEPVEKAKPKKKDSPPPKKRLTISEIRDATIDRLHAACEKQIAQGRTELPVHIPTYLGAWATAITALDRLRADDTPRPSAIVFPHAPLLPAFRTFVNDMLNDRAAFYEVETPKTMATWLREHLFESVIVPDDMDKALEEQLRANSSFILRLLQKSPPEPEPTEEVPAFSAPSYHTFGLRQISWSPEDSVRYLQEWRFATGQKLGARTAQELGKQGLGPSLNLINKGTDYTTLKAKAGYYASE